MRAFLVLCVLPALSLAAGLGTPGGLTDIQLEPDDPNVLFAVLSINGYYGKQGDTATRQLVTVEKAQSQVVAGTLYHLLLRVNGGAEEELCKVNVWSRPWLSGDEAMQTTEEPACKPVSAAVTKMPLAGGASLIDLQSPEVLKAQDFAVNSLNMMENSMNQRRAVNVQKVTSQVVSGVSYHFYGVEMAMTQCMKGSTQELSTCELASPSDVRTCEFIVWWQAWKNPEYQLTKVDCK